MQLTETHTHSHTEPPEQTLQSSRSKENNTSNSKHAKTANREPKRATRTNSKKFKG